MLNLIKICSVATAASFGASALANGMIFWAGWRINYFMIASPTDVVMGGFAIVAQLPWLFAAAFILLNVGMRVFAWLLSTLLLSWQIIETRWRVSPEDNGLLFWLSMMLAITTAVPVSLWGFHGWDRSLWSLRDARVQSPFVYRTGLRVASESTLSRGCVGRPILWMGTNAAVLDCQQGVRVIHKLDPLITELSTSVPAE